MSQKMTMELMLAMGVALTGETMDVVALPEANCAECEYDKMPHDGLHCYMFKEAPDNGLCGAFEPTQYKMKWKP